MISVGPVHQRAADDQLLPHPVAVGLGQLVLPGGQVEDLEQLVDPALHGGAVLAIERGGEPEELAAGELVVDERPVGNESDAGLGLERVPQHVHAAHQTEPLVGCRIPAIIRMVVVLPAPFGSQQPEQLAPRHVERDAVHRGELAVALRQVRQPDHAVLRTMASTASRSSCRSTTMQSSDGPSAGAGPRKGLHQQPGGFRHGELTAVGARPAARRSGPVPTRRHAARRKPSARRTVARATGLGESRMTTWITKGAARSPPPVTTAAPASSGELTRAGRRIAGPPRLIEPRGGGRQRLERFAGGPQQGVHPERSEVVHHDGDHRSCSSRLRWYISRASSGRPSRSSTRPRR